ncbi:MAG: glycoside hydrolase family 127 protein [Bacteroidaceae bacterium]|nr:glycoside hydrolase family 127 protein [Bacteroidaceae bacterium]
MHSFAIQSENALSMPSKAKKRTIKSVETIKVNTPVGTAPRLPFQVWVTYSDGTGEWRQTKWANSATETEQQQADPTQNPVGSTYQVKGVVIGDNTTLDGYPITAEVTVVAEAWTVPSNKPVAEPLPLNNVTITGDNRLTSNRDLDIREILSWDITQQLYNYRDTYGMPTEGYTRSDGWDSPTTKLKGHGSGHYMSALAFAYSSVATLKDKGNEKAELYKRIERMVNELRECQERTFVWDSTLNRYREARDYAPEEVLKDMKGNWQAFNEYKKDYKNYGYGYLNAIPAAHPALIECYRAYNNEEWVWAPYYSIHKQLAGLIDICNALKSTAGAADVKSDQKSGNELADKALLIAKDMGLWVWNRLHYRTYVKTDGTKQERQAKPGNRYEMWNMYIAGEVGGMAESLSRLSEMVADPTEKARLLEAANFFDSPAFYDPVAKNVDDIRTRHANQHIPMITGALRSFRGNANPYYYNLAYNFWTMVQGRYAYAMGGVGNGEMFRQPYSQMLSMNTSVSQGWGRNRQMVPNPDMNETCCAYNLAKLTKDLNCFDPDNAEYMDYYERILYNQIVGSVDADHYATTYQYAVGLNATKPFGNETPQSSCCGGTGAENHVKYQEAAYFANDNTLWVALYLPTEAVWKNDSQNVVISQECLWPAEKSTIKVAPVGTTGKFTMKLRVPYWATEGFDVKLNGQSVAKTYKPCSYVEIPERQWTSSDVVEVVMPFTKHINFGPDKMELAATREDSKKVFDPMWIGTVMYGPLVMAATDIDSWDKAEFELSSDLSEITLNRPTATTGVDGNLYTLSLAGKTFQPDYYVKEGITHYLRLNVSADGKKKTSSKKVDASKLQQVLKVAAERKANQEAWDALAVKVPNFAPWAPNGYARLMQQMKKAEEVVAKKKKATQAEVNSAVSEMNAIINTMRPGNLAEPEDLNELLPLLTETKEIRNKTTELREAIDYADMVVGYVNDGSGTQDFIVKALDRLKEALKTVKK